MLADGSQQSRRQATLLEERENRRRSVVADRVERRASEPHAPAAKANPSRRRRRERIELREPARRHGPKLAILRQAQEACPLAKLAILVAAANDVSALEPVHRKRDDVQMMIRIDQ